MTIEEIVKYVLNTPHNTNRAILMQMLRQLAEQGETEEPDLPDTDKEIIYDGGVEG